MPANHPAIEVVWIVFRHYTISKSAEEKKHTQRQLLFDNHHKKKQLHVIGGNRDKPSDLQATVAKIDSWYSPLLHHGIKDTILLLVIT